MVDADMEAMNIVSRARWEDTAVKRHSLDKEQANHRRIDEGGVMQNMNKLAYIFPFENSMFGKWQ
jgi:hypothetical protein